VVYNFLGVLCLEIRILRISHLIFVSLPDITHCVDVQGRDMMYCVRIELHTTGLPPELAVKCIQDDRGFDPVVQKERVGRYYEPVYCADIPVYAAQQRTRVVDFRNAGCVLPVRKAYLMKIQVCDISVESRYVD
jgi:hypothetical protein